MDPTSLKCRHFFCKTCIDEMNENEDEPKYKCPICKEHTCINQCEKMTFINRLVCGNDGKSNRKQKCDRCDKISSVGFCNDCHEYFCRACQESHNSWNSMKGHSWKESGNMNDTHIDDIVHCHVHTGEAIGYYCKPCKKPACKKCIEEPHQNPSFRSISSALNDDILPEVQKQKELLKKTIQSNESDNDTIINHAGDLKRKYEEIDTMIDDKCEATIKQIREEKTLLKGKLAEIKRKQLNKIEDYVNDVELRITSGKNTLTLCESTLQNTKNASMLCTLHSQIQDRLVTAAEERLPFDEMIKMPVKATFKPTITDCRPILGKVHETYHNYRTKHIAHNLETIASKEFSTTGQCSLDFFPRQFVRMGNEIWCVQNGSNRIHCMSLDMEFINVKVYKEIGNILAIVGFESVFFVAATNGLFRIDKKNENQRRI